MNLGKTKVMVSSGITKHVCLKIKLTHVGSAAYEQRLTQFCVHGVVSRSTVDVPECEG